MGRYKSSRRNEQVNMEETDKTKDHGKISKKVVGGNDR